MPNRPDLSQRQIGAIPRLPTQQFRNRNYVNGSAQASADLFTPAAACSMIWVLVQLQAQGTVQLLLNGQPISAALALNAGDIVRYPSTFLANNERMSLSSTAAFVFELCWVKDFIDPPPITTVEVYRAGSSGGSAHQNVNIFDSQGGTLLGDGNNFFTAIHDSGGSNINSTASALWVEPHANGSVYGSPTNPFVSQIIGTTGHRADVDASGDLLTISKIQDSNGASITVGQKTSANSVPVVLASDESSVPVAGVSPSRTIDADVFPLVFTFPTVNGTTVVTTTPSGYKGIVVYVSAAASAANITLLMQMQEDYFDDLVNYVNWQTIINNVAIATGGGGVYRTLIYPASGVALGAGGTATVNIVSPIPKRFKLTIGIAGTGWVAGASLTFNKIGFEWLV